MRDALFAGLLMAAFGPVCAAGIQLPAGAGLNLGDGRLAMPCGDLLIEGRLAAGSVAVLGARDVSIGPSGLLQGASAQLHVSGNWSNQGVFDAGSSSVVFEDGCRPVSTLSGDNRFYDLVFVSTTGKTFLLESGRTQTVAHGLSVTGIPGQPVILDSTAGDIPPAYLSLEPGAGHTLSDSIVRAGHIVMGGAPIPTLSTLSFLLLILAGLWAGGRALVRRNLAMA
ncbi:MAG: hypothetical protein AB1766_10815 [Pseudomonadota bacterium]